MKDNMEYFKEASNLLLKDIHTTEKLKKMTLEKCKSQKKNRIKPILATVASVAFLIMGFTYNYFFNNSTIPRNYVDNNEQQYKNSNDSEKVKEASKTKSTNELAKSVNDSSKNKGESTTSDISKVDDNSNKNNTNTTNSADSIAGSFKSPSSNSSSVNSTQSPLPPNENFSGKESYKGLQGIASPQKNLDMATAEKYFESKIITPSYVPDGFNLTDISIPDAKLKCIKLKYSSDSSYFEIYESKNLSNLDGSKTVYINSNKAYINYAKDSKSATTQIVWTNNNVQYYLSSTLPEDSLINIAKSIN